MPYDYSTAIAEPVRADILNRLAGIEREEEVRILLAVESGSRAWGFPSADSDYDVRFLYIRPHNWYLSVNLEQKKDVLDYPIVDLIDIGGWDLRKALGLLHRSNLALMEWLQSPIIYRETTPLALTLRQLMPRFYAPVTAFHHYLSMAKGTYKDFLLGEHVRTKKYFYALRPLLAAVWVERGFGPAPMEFDRLAEKLIEDETLRDEIDRLRMRKLKGEEGDEEKSIPLLRDFIATELARLEEVRLPGLESKPDIEELHRFFRRAIEEA